MHEFVTDAADLRRLLLGMRAAYARGENVMAWARQNLGYDANRAVAILVAYDLQTGAYVERARSDPEANAQWVAQLAGLLDPYMMPGVSLLEVGCGEATTLNGVIQQFGDTAIHALGFDISWSRIAQGQAWLHEHATSARLFVGDLFDIPLDDNSIDVIYTSHSIEPNGGLEQEAIQELLRVARRAVVLVEPIYELADEPAQRRMEEHGYVRGLKACAEHLGVKIADYRLLPYTANALNPSGVLVLEKDREAPIRVGGGDRLALSIDAYTTAGTSRPPIRTGSWSGLSNLAWRAFVAGTACGSGVTALTPMISGSSMGVIQVYESKARGCRPSNSPDVVASDCAAVAQYGRADCGRSVGGGAISSLGQYCRRG